MKTSFIFLFLLINLIHLLNTLNTELFRNFKTEKKLANDLYKFINNIPFKCQNKTQKKCNSICYKDLQYIEIPLKQDDKKNMVKKLLKVYYDKTIPEKNKKKEMGVVVINFLKIIEKNEENKVFVRKSETNRPDKTVSPVNRPHKIGSGEITSYKTKRGTNRPDKTSNAKNKSYILMSAANRPSKKHRAANTPDKKGSGANKPISIEKVIKFFYYYIIKTNKY